MTTNITNKYKIGDEVYYSGFNEIYIVAACKGDESNNQETKDLLKKWDYLITKKDKYGLIQVKENLIRIV